MPPLQDVRCLVLGAGGFLGRALSAALCDAGAVVRGFGHPPREGAELDGRVRWFPADFSDASAVARAVEEQELVFHVLGSASPETPGADVTEHVSRSVRLFDACHTAKVRKVVFASSGGAVYGVAPTIPTPETTPTKPISAYGLGHVAIEDHLARYRSVYGSEYLVLRIGNVYGPGQSPLRRQGVVAASVHRALSGQPLEFWGPGETTRDFVHVDDAVAALVQGAAYGGEHRVMNVGTGRGRSLRELQLDLKRLLNVPHLPVVRKPGRPVDVPVSVLDAGAIAREIAWRPRVSWFDGLASTAAWIRARYLP